MPLRLAHDMRRLAPNENAAVRREGVSKQLVLAAVLWARSTCSV